MGRLTNAFIWTVKSVASEVFLNRALASPLVPKPLRWRVLRALGYRIENCAIASSCFIGGLGLSIGENTFINHGVLFDCSAPISIGKRCDVGPRVTMITGSHKVGGSERRAGPKTAAPISIGDGAWIGASCTILPGVTIGRGAVIAAGSVVTRDCLPDTLYAGVPARRIRDIEALVAAHD